MIRRMRRMFQIILCIVSYMSFLSDICSQLIPLYFPKLSGVMNWWNWYSKSTFTEMDPDLSFILPIWEEFMLLKGGLWSWWRKTGSSSLRTQKRPTYFILHIVHASCKRLFMCLIRITWNHCQYTWGTMWIGLLESIHFGTVRMALIISLSLAMTGWEAYFSISDFLMNARDYWSHYSYGYPFSFFWCATNFLQGPYTVNEHRELSQNTIKALCNADVSEGVFKLGKDVSLPETTIRTPRKPLRNVGGKRVSQRPILAFFAGNMHGRVRPTLLRHWKDKDDDIRVYGPLPQRISRKMSYIQHMKSSKYCICPMGYEVNSPRIIEAIYYECVPVIIADNFVLPFSEFLDWSAFSVVVAEKDIPKLKEILTAIPLRRYLAMQINVKMVQKHFLWNPKPLKYDLFHMVLHSIWFSRLNRFQIPGT